MSENTVTKLYYSVSEASEALSISKPHLYRLVKQGQISAVKFGARVLIPRQAIEEMVFEPYPVSVVE